MNRDPVDIAIGLVVAILVIALLCSGAVGVADFFFDRASYEQQADCRAHQMEPVRKLVSRTVRCVPPLNRQDTTTVRIK